MVEDINQEWLFNPKYGGLAYYDMENDEITVSIPGLCHRCEDPFLETLTAIIVTDIEEYTHAHLDEENSDLGLIHSYKWSSFLFEDLLKEYHGIEYQTGAGSWTQIILIYLHTIYKALK